MRLINAAILWACLRRGGARHTVAGKEPGLMRTFI